MCKTPILICMSIFNDISGLERLEFSDFCVFTSQESFEQMFWLVKEVTSYLGRVTSTEAFTEERSLFALLLNNCNMY